MRKKWLALALSMAMVVGSITGCGGSDSNKDASDSSKSNDSAKVTATRMQVIHQRATIQQKWKQ